MTIETLFYTQIAAIFSFVIAVFTLYRLLVKAKDATIESQKAISEAYKAQISHLESTVKTLSDQRPDVLLQRLEKRSERLQEELQEAEQEQRTLETEIDELKMTQGDSQKTLEARVDERTRELANVIRKLADANERLAKNLKNASIINESSANI